MRPAKSRSLSSKDVLLITWVFHIVLGKYKGVVYGLELGLLPSNNDDTILTSISLFLQLPEVQHPERTDCVIKPKPLSPKVLVT